MKKRFFIYLILFLFLDNAIFANYEDYVRICRMSIYGPIIDKGPFYSHNVGTNIKENVGKFTRESMVCLEVTIAMDRKLDKIRFLKKVLEQKVRFKEMTEREMKKKLEEETKKIPEEVRLFDKTVHFSKFLKVYCTFPNGEKKEISEHFNLRYLSDIAIESREGKNVINIMLFFKKDFIKSLRRGLYKINIVYDSRNSKVDTVWKGKLENSLSTSEINIELLYPKTRIQYLAGKLNWVYYCGIYTNIFSKEEIDEIISSGERILSEEPGFYLCHLYLGHINYNAYKRYGDERYKKDAYNEYKKWLKIFDDLRIQGVLDDKEWKDYSYFIRDPIEKRLKELE